MQEVAQRLKSLRESVGVSQAKLAALPTFYGSVKGL